MKRQKKRDLKFASIFSGCGGFDLGFIQEGFRCISAFDNDPFVIDVHSNNLKSVGILCDLSNGSVPFDTLSNLDVLLAGPPCQGFSTAGKREFNDPRNDLLLVAGRIAIKVRPRVFIAENVSGVTAKPHREYWEALREMLLCSGYRTVDFLCEGTKMGIPQIRKRMVMLAWDMPRDITVVMPQVDGGTLRTALAGLNNGIENHEPKLLPHGSDFEIIAKNIKPGQKLSNVRGGHRSVHTWNIPEIFGKTTAKERLVLETIMRIRRCQRVRDVGDADPVSASSLYAELGFAVIEILRSLERKGFVRRIGRLYDLAQTFNGKYRRLDWDKPSLTVDTRFGNPKYFLHPSEHRGFTVREAARIQGFPDDFIFIGSERIQYRMVGNAVPPPLAKCLARFVREALF